MVNFEFKSQMRTKKVEIKILKIKLSKNKSSTFLINITVKYKILSLLCLSLKKSTPTSISLRMWLRAQRQRSLGTKNSLTKNQHQPEQNITPSHGTFLKNKRNFTIILTIQISNRNGLEIENRGFTAKTFQSKNFTNSKSLNRETI